MPSHTPSADAREYRDRFQEPAQIYPNPNLLPLANYLEHIIILLTRAINSRDSDLIRGVLSRYFAPRLQVAVGEPYTDVLSTTSRETYAQKMIAFLQSTPNFRAEAFNTTALVNEQNGTAKVFTMNRVSGFHNGSQDITTESTLAYYFERDARKDWICVRFDVIRGPGYNNQLW